MAMNLPIVNGAFDLSQTPYGHEVDPSILPETMKFFYSQPKPQPTPIGPSKSSMPPMPVPRASTPMKPGPSSMSPFGMPDWVSARPFEVGMRGLPQPAPAQPDWVSAIPYEIGMRGPSQPAPAQAWKPPFELNDLSDLLKQALAAKPAALPQPLAPQPQQQQQQQALTPQQQYGGTNYTSLMNNPYQSTFMPGAMRERQQTGLTMGRYF